MWNVSECMKRHCSKLGADSDDGERIHKFSEASVRPGTRCFQMSTNEHVNRIHEVNHTNAFQIVKTTQGIRRTRMYSLDVFREIVDFDPLAFSWIRERLKNRKSVGCRDGQQEATIT